MPSQVKQSQTIIQRALCLLMLPLLLSMGVLDWACLCSHAEPATESSCCSELAAPDKASTQQEDCAAGEGCCCLESVPLVDPSSVVEATSPSTFEDLDLLAAIHLASPLSGCLIPQPIRPMPPARARLGAIAWPAQPPLFARFEAYLC